MYAAQVYTFPTRHAIKAQPMLRLLGFTVLASGTVGLLPVAYIVG